MRDSIRELADGSICLRIRVDECVRWLQNEYCLDGTEGETVSFPTSPKASAG